MIDVALGRISVPGQSCRSLDSRSCGRVYIQHIRSLHSTRTRTHYETLGINQNASLEDIKSAFYEKSKQLHPDNSAQGSSTAEFVELKTAYDILRRPADRRLYDLGLKGIRNGRYLTYEQKMNSYRNPYSGYAARPQYDFTRDWSTYWSQNPDTKDTFRERERSTQAFMNSTFKYLGIGVAIVVLYNCGYLIMLSANEKKLEKLCDQDEIAKCFLRQKEFQNLNFEQADISEIGRILKADVDEAWKTRAKNSDEIREEHRWFRALQDTDHIRSLKEKRAQTRLENRNRWREEQ